MDKNAIKKYAVWARNELIERVSQKADQYEISADADPNADAVHGVLLTPSEKKQRVSLITKVKDKGMDQVIEEVAYTWFNRFAALRFMEVNNYLPSKVRVFTDNEGAFKPEILAEAIHLEMEGLDMERVYALKDANDDDALFKYLIITQCNTLSKVLPGMFQKIADYTELLFPDNQLREGSVIEQMVTMIPEADWKDQVQIIGWLYQYYNTEPKDKVFADLKKNKKITKEKIPAATQLFTPDWIVRYMVENSLGRLWVEGHPNDELKASWKYYLDEAEQEPEVQKQLDDTKKEYAALTPEKIRCIDPCMGSGHIICYMFDVLMQIYEAYGYTARDAASSIVRNNLYGLDIDERASQLAYFAVLMKACQYDRRFLSRGIQPHVYAIMEGNHFDPNMIDFFTDGRKELKAAISSLVSDLHDAKEYGSILNVRPVDFTALYARFDEIRNENPNMYTYQILDELLPFVQVAEAMAQKYHIVCTNPPYAAAKGLSKILREYLTKQYEYGKYDIFAAFILRCTDLALKIGNVGLITPVSVLYNPSFKQLREQLITVTNIEALVELGEDAFDGGFGTVMYVLSRKKIKDYVATFYDVSQEINKNNFKETTAYISSIDFFSEFDDSKFLYKLNVDYRQLLKKAEPLSAYGVARIGMQTNDNNRFLRLWFEIERIKLCINHSRGQSFGDYKWFPIVKGGGFRKWYGNIEAVVNWQYNGAEIRELNKNAAGGRIVAEEYYFCEGLTWTHTTYTQPFSIRFMPKGTMINVEGPAIFSLGENQNYVLGCLNSIVAQDVFDKVISSIHFSANELSNFPLIINNSMDIDTLVRQCINIAILDWDSFEVSWDFQKHPLIRKTATIAEAFTRWQTECNDRFNKLKSNEEELNRIFINIYGLQDELTPEEGDKDVTIRKADLSRDIRSFVSYAVGCMFGRYSLDADGLAYAGGDWDASKYKTFMPDKDAILPITDDEYFTDDIVGRFVEFVRAVYGADTLEENLKFIADALDEKGSTSREVIRNYFLNGFYKDHLKTYQKRPIYWLFDSGKKNGFKCLVYMHRYRPDTIARIRTDYVHEQQARYRTAISGLERQINGAQTSERVRLNKLMTKLKDQAEETRLYEEKIHHLADQMIEIDLDDGVKHNYAIFQDVLAKIK